MNATYMEYTGARWYDAVDGVGFLLLALLYLDTGGRELEQYF